MFTRMRRVIAWLVIAATQLLVITPTLPATACISAAEHAQQHAAMHQGHDHTSHWFDWGTLRIECGCGCHASTDGLPMQLAPHAPAAAPMRVVIVSAFSAALPSQTPEGRYFSKDSPPPKRA